MSQNVQKEYGWSSADDSCAHEYTLPSVLRVIERHSRILNRPLRILDLGCGNGAAAARIAENGHSVTAVDVSPDGIEIAHRAFPTVEFQVASIYEPDLAQVISGENFDCVVSLDVVEHLFFPRKLLQQSHAMLAGGGLLILSTPYHGYWKNLALSIVGGWDNHFSVQQDGGHIKFFSRKSLARMVREVGFKEMSVKGEGRLPWLWKTMILVAKK